MKIWGDALFNLMLNAAVSFWVGLGTALLLIATFKTRASALSVLILALPFVKVLWDFRGGIPADSFFWAFEHGAKQRLGQFQIGFGLTRFGPGVHGQLSSLHASGRSPQSIADLACRWLSYRVWRYAASVLSFAVASVSLAKLGTRLRGYVAFRRQLTFILREAIEVEIRRVGLRSARVFSSSTYEGVPFACGFLRLYVVLPKTLASALSVPEREAVIQHELGHLAHHDLPVLVLFECLCQLFWYIPGTGFLLTRLRSLLEQRADDAALRAGVSRGAIASALLSVAELSLPTTQAPALAMTRGGSALRARIQRLLAPEATGLTHRRWWLLLRGPLILWLILGTLQAAACGNHPG